MDPTFEQARDFFVQGVEHYEAGRMVQAERAFQASLALVPGRPSTLANLGATRLKLGKLDLALEDLEAALEREPGHAQAWGHKGTALAEQGRLAPALAAFDRAVALAPELGTAWSFRGSVLKDLGRLDEAAESYEKALAHGADPGLNRYYLAALKPEVTPDAPPRHYVQALFDNYARDFDEHLVAALRYEAPRVLAERVVSSGDRFARALDLGCGTGLCGKALAPACDAIDGVDLSAAMLEKAQATGAYANLVQADVVEFLASAGGPYDLVVSADVFIYVGKLDEVFGGLSRVMAPGGVFAFTVESVGDGDDFVLRPSLRYAHSERYLRRLASDHGFTIEHLERRPVREDQRLAIPGIFCWMRAS